MDEVIRMKRMILMLMTVFSLLVMTACGTADKDENANGSEEGNGTSQVEENNDDAANDTENEPGDEEVTDGDATEDDVDMEIIKVEGSYTGLMDPHSIEVITEDEPLALQILDPAVADVKFEEIDANAHVIIEYYKNDVGQNILKNIDVQ